MIGYKKATGLRKAPAGHYWVRFAGETEWNIGYLWRGGNEVFFNCNPPHVYGYGSFGLSNDMLKGAVFAGPIPEPTE